MSYLLKNTQVLLENEFQTGRLIWIKGKKVHAILSQGEALPKLPIIDLEGHYLAPALIDLQVNGFGGISLNPTMSEQALQSVHCALMKHGCCSYLPTLISAPFELMKENLRCVRQTLSSGSSAVLGIHFEGPYLHPRKKGIHNIQYIREPSSEEIDYWSNHPEGIALMTLAPEQCSGEIIRRLAAAGIPLAAGHSQASYLQSMAGFQAGIVAATHLFNAMSPLESREPGLVGALLASGQAYTCAIPDGHHVSWPALKIAIKTIRSDRLCFVTDALAAAGSDLKTFCFADKTIFVKEGCCCDDQGRLAGSILTPIQALQNAVHHLELGLPEAIRALSSTPAALLGRSHDLGSIHAGAFANLIVIDRHLNLNSVIFEGSFKINGLKIA